MMKTKAIIAIIILILIGTLLYFAATAKAAKVAYLNIENGTVEIDRGKGWMQAEDEAELGLNDRIRTLDGEAVIVLYESILINLEANTEVAIRELSGQYIKIKQDTGSTWNKFTGLAGVEGMSIETPTTVATVRGTEFGVTMDEVIVAEGEVEVQKGDEKVEVSSGKKARIIQGKLEKAEMTQEERQKIIHKMKKTVKRLELAEKIARERQNIIRKKIIEFKERKKPALMKDIPKEKIREQIEKQKQAIQEIQKKKELLKEKATDILSETKRELLEKAPETRPAFQEKIEEMQERLRTAEGQQLPPERVQAVTDRFDRPTAPERTER